MLPSMKRELSDPGLKEDVTNTSFSNEGGKIVCNAENKWSVIKYFNSNNNVPSLKEGC